MSITCRIQQKLLAVYSSLFTIEIFKPCLHTKMTEFLILRCLAFLYVHVNSLRNILKVEVVEVCVSLFWDFYRDFIVVCEFCSYCLPISVVKLKFLSGTELYLKKDSFASNGNFVKKYTHLYIIGHYNRSVRIMV